MASTYRHFRMIGMTLLAIATAVAQAQPPDNRPGPRGGPPATRGADMITSEERAAFCTRMRESRTPEEREAIMRGMHELMQSRARERGVPPPQGQGYGPRGLDQGMGCGPMMEGGPRGPARSGAPPAAAGAGSGAAAIPPTAGGVASPRERQVDGLVYLSGGIGTDEAAAMRSAADRYSLRLTFSGRGANTWPMSNRASTAPTASRYSRRSRTALSCLCDCLPAATGSWPRGRERRGRRR
ncbi:hypothetical protein CURE108131_02865 [Cupriavidus respiraculi]|uniref:Uncharacterized protein n=1 Tax=Cupriavidus respiraculi TaxID=195930 RepID=A0ABM8WGV5_9BURK|nr:hypothetical protein LMG21510_00445 [Cupriavidus respiraculi]